jgi:hypothetical protein
VQAQGASLIHTDSNYPPSGSFESGVIEINSLTLDNISWNQNLPEGTTVAVQARTGNTVDPNAANSGWTDWSSPMTDPAGSAMTTAEAKYIQYKVTMTTSDSTVAPSFNISNDSPLTVGFKRSPVDSSEIDAISCMTVEKDGVVTKLEGPEIMSKIDGSKLVFDHS